MRIRVVRNYDFPDFLRQSKKGSGKWDGIQFIESEQEQHDFLICLNPPSSPISTHLPKNRRWLLTQEPPIEDWDWHKDAFPYFGRIFTQHKTNQENIINTQTCLPWHIHKTYDELYNLLPFNKANKISTVTSNLQNLTGQKLRVSFIQYIKNIGFELDIYGKGVYYIEDKFDGLYPYKYNLAIENSFFPHYWTEKIADCFLSWTMPIYAGCPNILDYFPKEAIILIDLNDFEKSKEIIHNAVKNDLWNKNLKAIEEARDLVLTKYQFFPRMADELDLEHLDTIYRKTKDKIPKFSSNVQPNLLKKLMLKICNNTNI